MPTPHNFPFYAVPGFTDDQNRVWSRTLWEINDFTEGSAGAGSDFDFTVDHGATANDTATFTYKSFTDAFADFPTSTALRAYLRTYSNASTLGEIVAASSALKNLYVRGRDLYPFQPVLSQMGFLTFELTNSSGAGYVNYTFEGVHVIGALSVQNAAGATPFGIFLALDHCRTTSLVVGGTTGMHNTVSIYDSYVGVMQNEVYADRILGSYVGGATLGFVELFQTVIGDCQLEGTFTFRRSTQDTALNAGGQLSVSNIGNGRSSTAATGLTFNIVDRGPSFVEISNVIVPEAQLRINADISAAGNLGNGGAGFYASGLIGSRVNMDISTGAAPGINAIPISVDHVQSLSIGEDSTFNFRGTKVDVAHVYCQSGRMSVYAKERTHIHDCHIASYGSTSTVDPTTWLLEVGANSTLRSRAHVHDNDLVWIDNTSTAPGVLSTAFVGMNLTSSIQNGIVNYHDNIVQAGVEYVDNTVTSTVLAHDNQFDTTGRA